jgi:hypothetical protein
MSDLSKARELEQLRFTELLNKLNIDERERVLAMNADFAARGLLHSGARMVALAKARMDKLQIVIEKRLEIRKDIARSFPELGTEIELDQLLAQFVQMLEYAASPPPEAPPGAVRDALKRRIEQDVYRLKAEAKIKVEILKRELALNLHKGDSPKTALTKTELPSALRRTIRDLNISTQNVLAFIATFVIPLVATVLGARLVVALAVGVCVVIWFLVLKTAGHVKSRFALIGFGVVCTALVLITGFIASAVITKANNASAPPQPAPPQQHYETHGAQSPIMPDNKGSVTITNQSGGVSPKKDEVHK